MKIKLFFLKCAGNRERGGGGRVGSAEGNQHQAPGPHLPLPGRWRGQTTICRLCTVSGTVSKRCCRSGSFRLLHFEFGSESVPKTRLSFKKNVKLEVCELYQDLSQLFFSQKICALFSRTTLTTFNNLHKLYRFLCLKVRYGPESRIRNWVWIS